MFSLNYRLKYKDISTVFATAKEEPTSFATTTTTTTTALQQTDNNSLAKMLIRDTIKKRVTKLGLSLGKNLSHVTLQRLMCKKVVNMLPEERL